MTKKTPRIMHHFKKAAGRVLFGLAALSLCGWLWPAALQAAGCYPDVYYEFMFKPEKQKALGGDVRLVGESDYLAAVGEDPPVEGGGSGCMCGVNYGRWDQMLRNDSPSKQGMAPVAFKIEGLQIDFADKQGRAKGKTINIKPDRLGKCFGASVKAKGYKAFNDKAGFSAAVNVLEPGENLVGCLCLDEKLRKESGTAKIKVRYRPVVFALPMKPAAHTQSGVFHGQAVLEGLSKGQAAYFRVVLPKSQRNPGIKISVGQPTGIIVYSRPAAKGWSNDLSDWRQGAFEDGSARSGEAYWIMALARENQAGGVVKVSYATSGSETSTVTGPGPVMVDLNQPGERTFTAHILGMGSGSKKNSFAAPPKSLRPCCSSAGGSV